MRKKRKDIFSYIETNKNTDIEKIIVKHNDKYNYIHLNNNSSIFFWIKTLKYIISFSLIISIIFAITIIIVNNKKEKDKKILILLKNNMSNTEEIEGYYIPKDRLSNPIRKKCSVENCKKCYGNSYNDTCILCLNNYNPIKDEKNKKIIFCEDNKNTTDIVFKTELITEKNTIDFLDNKTELITNVNSYNIPQKKLI